MNFENGEFEKLLTPDELKRHLKGEMLKWEQHTPFGIEKDEKTGDIIFKFDTRHSYYCYKWFVFEYKLFTWKCLKLQSGL